MTNRVGISHSFHIILSSTPSKNSHQICNTRVLHLPHLRFNSMDAQPSSAAVEIVTVDVHGAKDLISSGHRYLDVRTEEEFKKGHVQAENALNIPYMFNTPQGRVKNPKFMEQVLSVCNKDDPLVVGCQTGVRSLNATSDLLNAEFKQVCNMGGGYVAWVENGFGVTKPQEEVVL